MTTETQKLPLPNSFWQTPGLTLENFSAKAQELFGQKTRFRRTKDQVARNLTRQEAFEETFALQNKN